LTIDNGQLRRIMKKLTIAMLVVSVLTACKTSIPSDLDSTESSESLSASSPPTTSASTEAVSQAEVELTWVVEPTLDYYNIVYIPGDPYDGYVAYTQSFDMYIIDPKTGGELEEIGPTGGLRDETEYGYDSVNDAFIYNEQYDNYPEDKEVVIEKSMNTMLAVWDENAFAEKEDGKWAVFYKGEFISGFDYDGAFSGGEVAFVGNYFVDDYGEFVVRKLAVMNDKGELVTDFDYDDASRIARGYVAVKKGEQWGLLDYDGNEILPFMFEHIEGIDEETVFAKIGGKYGILKIKQ